jgi:hypothetical protein
MSLSSVHAAFVHDFRDAWDAVAAYPRARGRGNFMFAFMATNYLEWAARIAAQDDRTRTRLADELGAADVRYFKKLPGMWPVRPEPWFPAGRRGIQATVLWAIFDLVRNGIAHRYQQIDAVLDGDARFRVQVVGADRAAYRLGDARPPDYLRPFTVRDLNPSYLVVRLYPDVLFADVEHAVTVSGLLGLAPLRFRRKFAVPLSKLRRAISTQAERYAADQTRASALTGGRRESL